MRLLVDANTVAVDSIFGWATSEWLSTLLENYAISSVEFNFT